MQLALETVSSDGELPVKLEVVKYDVGGDALKGMTTAYKIAADNEICAVIGHGYSDVSLPCSLIYQYYGILTFNFISTIHTLTDRNNPLLVSNMPSDSDFGEEIAKLCDKNGYKSVVIYYLENTSGTSISNAFEMNCSKRGISVVSLDSYDLTTSPQEFERMVRRWKNNFMFDVIFLAGRMPAIKDIISVVRENGIVCPIVGSDPFDTRSWPKVFQLLKTERFLRFLITMQKVCIFVSGNFMRPLEKNMVQSLTRRRCRRMMCSWCFPARLKRRSLRNHLRLCRH